MRGWENQQEVATHRKIKNFQTVSLNSPPPSSRPIVEIAAADSSGSANSNQTEAERRHLYRGPGLQGSSSWPGGEISTCGGGNWPPDVHSADVTLRQLEEPVRRRGRRRQRKGPDSERDPQIKSAGLNSD